MFDFEAFTKAILHHRALTIAALCVVVGVVVGGMAFLRADFSIESFFGVDDPETAYLNEYRERWGESDLLMIVADGGEQGLLARTRLQELDQLATKLEATEGIGEVMSVTRVPRVNRGPAGLWIPVPLLATAPRAEPDDPRVLSWKQALLADPQVVPTYLSRDGRYGTVLLSLSVDTNDLTKVQPVVRAVEQVLADTPLDGVSFYVGGVPAIRADVLSVIVRDQVTAVPISGLLMGILLLSLFRSLHGVLIPVLAAAVPNLMLLGVMGWTGENFGLLNQVYLALVPAIAVADAVHLVARYHEESRDISADAGDMTTAGRDVAIAKTMRFMGVACFLTSFTTIVGFLSLQTASMPVLRSFGLYAAVGVALAYFTVLVLVPIALQYTKAGARRLPHGTEGPLGTVLSWCVTLTTKHAWACVGGAALVTAASLYAGSFVVTDNKLTETFSDDHPVSVANRIVDDHLGGVLALEFDLKGAPGAFEDPVVLAAIAKLEADMEGTTDLRTTVSVASLLRVTSKLVGGPDGVPASGNVAKKLYEIASQADIVNSFVNADKSRSRVMVRMKDVGAVDFLARGEVLSETFGEALGPLGIETHLSGSTFVSSRGMPRVAGDMRDSLIAAFGFIGVLIALLFRSVRYGILSLAPNALPLLVGYGIMGLMGWQLEIGRAVVFTIAIGVSVDSAIHVLARFTEDRERGLSVDAAIESAIYHSGRAIAVTGLLLIVGFAVNINSSSPSNSAFGRLGSIIIFGALVSNLIVLPALLKLGFGRQDEAAKA